MKKFAFSLFFAIPLLLAAQNWDIAISPGLTPKTAQEVSKTGIALAGSKKIDIKNGRSVDRPFLFLLS